MGSGRSEALAAWLCGLLLVAACSGRLKQNDGIRSAGGTGGAVSVPIAEPGGDGGAPPSAGGGSSQAGGGSSQAGGGSSQAGGGSAAGRETGGGGVGESSGGEGGIVGPYPASWWDCPLETWGDGRCDCGCGLRDIDCPDGDVATCEACDSAGSCNGAPCPGRINAVDNRFCDPPPLGWNCPWPSYADESSCDCGCGIPDPDCEDGTLAMCDTCKLPGACGTARTDGCSTAIDPADLSRCYVPEAWICYGNYGDGVCNCGCGALDVDCASSSLEECEDCTDGCSGSACPGKVSPADNALCTPPPAGWRCADHRYRDFHFCDCGCGVVDPDCASSAAESCEWCNDEGSCSVRTCPGTIAPTNNAVCHQPAPPAWWTCPASDYADGVTCDCGCGAYDLDCPNEGPEVCDDCHSCGPCPDSIYPTSNSSCL